MGSAERREMWKKCAERGESRRSPNSYPPPFVREREPLQNRTSGAFCTVKDAASCPRGNCASAKARETAVSLRVLSGTHPPTHVCLFVALSRDRCPTVLLQSCRAAGARGGILTKAVG